MHIALKLRILSLISNVCIYHWKVFEIPKHAVFSLFVEDANALYIQFGLSFQNFQMPFFPTKVPKILSKHCSNENLCSGISLPLPRSFSILECFIQEMTLAIYKSMLKPFVFSRKKTFYYWYKCLEVELRTEVLRYMIEEELTFFIWSPSPSLSLLFYQSESF